MSKRLNLKRARQHRPARPAHTAAGRDILGAWGWFERIVLLATFASILLASVAFWIDYRDRIEARRVNAATLAEIAASQITRRDEAIARAWTTLTTAAPGNSGKREALEFLAEQGVSLTGLNLSCERMGGDWRNEPVRRCSSPVFLMNLSFERALPSHVDLTEANLSGANLVGAIMDGVNLRGARVESAELWMATLSNAYLGGAVFDGSNLNEAVLRGSVLWSVRFRQASLRDADLRDTALGGADFSNANLSGSDFRGARGVEGIVTSGAWAWEDQKPVGLPDNILLTLCRFDPSRHGRFTRPNPCLPPLN